MSDAITAIRGMNDIVEDQAKRFNQFEQVVHQLLHQYGYQMVRLPVVEATRLFKRSIGEVTDIVEKEMYTFDDRNGDSLTLRPEGTAGLVRAVIQQGMVHNQTQKLAYLGPMFRYERPQKGRYRQFHQLGVETFGFDSATVEVELLAFGHRLWQTLGLNDVRLEINSLGQAEQRAHYREALIDYYEQHQDQLDEDVKRRLHSNPMRILDSKHPDVQAINVHAPQLSDYLATDCVAHFEQVKQGLDALGIDYHINPKLVRGLDYYNRTVFEWITDDLGTQGTICAGGRYDGLVTQLGGKHTPAAGFAMGIERILALMAQVETGTTADADVFVMSFGDGTQVPAMTISEQLRTAFPDLTVVYNLSGGSFKSQFKKADKSGAAWAVIVGEDEWQTQSVAVKPLRITADQQRVPVTELIGTLQTLLTSLQGT